MVTVTTERTLRAQAWCAAQDKPVEAKALVERFGLSARTARRVRASTRMVEGTADAVLFLYDVHLPYEDAGNIELALDHAQANHRITRIVLGGDLLDCATISKFAGPPNGLTLADEFTYAVRWLEGLRKRFPGIPITFIVGNHEQRLERFLWTRSPELDGLKGLTIKEQLELDRLGIAYVDNLKLIGSGEPPYSIGKLTVLHGHEFGICPNINPARQYFLRAMDNIIVGHVHQVNDYFTPTIRQETKGAFVCGCLCDMHPAYRPQNTWTAGFGIGLFEPSGLFRLDLRRIIGGRVL